MASCGSAAQRGIWPPVALQPSAGYGLLWLCSPARAMASCGSAAQRGLWPPRPRGFVITHNDAPQSVGLLWTSDQLVAETSTWQYKTHTTDKHPYPGGIRTHDRSRRATVDLRFLKASKVILRFLSNVIIYGVLTSCGIRHKHYRINGDQKVSVHLMITVKKTCKHILNGFNHLPW
jgi:hypothetical protein